MGYKEPKFYNKDGSLTAYSFSCGYVQKSEILQVEMWKEHWCYHILRRAKGGEVIRHTTGKLGEAWATYRAYIRQAKAEQAKEV